MSAWTFAPKVVINRWRIRSESNPLEHFHMIRALFRVSSNVPGCAVECGTYKGGSAANLSLACAKVGRVLHVFDSFCGLPSPKDCDQNHHSVGVGRVLPYERGQFAGGLAEVRQNISRFGTIGSCEFHPGYFSDSLPGFSHPVVLGFLDVDLRSSLEDCVRNLWPLLQRGCRLYSHEAADFSIASLFFDREWWRESLNCSPPGLVGAGNGLGLVPGKEGFRSNLGFAVKA
jgi:O-methyltransferase